MLHQYPFILFLLSCSVNNAFTQSVRFDTTFGENGIVKMDIDDKDHLYDIVIQEDQKILASGTKGGHPGIGGIETMALVRYMQDGSLDMEFGDSGIVSIQFFEYWFQQLYNINLQKDGRIILGGFVSYEGGAKDILEDFALIRLNIDGSLDTTFGQAGLVVTDVGGNYEFVREILVQQDGKIIAAGTNTLGTIGSFAGFTMVRYESNGDIDLGFGDEGVVKTDIREFAEITGAVIQPDGKIVLAGYVHQNDFLVDFIMVRYHENGEIDSLFGNNGIVQTDLEGTSQMDLATSIVLEEDGKIVLGGYANFKYTPSEIDIGIVRYNSDGSLDKSFANNGVALIQFGSVSRMQDMMKLSDGGYLLAGNSNVADSTQQWFLIRLKSGGELDTSFANGGIHLTDIEGENEFLSALLMQDDGKIVVGGLNYWLSYQDFVLARYIFDVETGIETIHPLSIAVFPNPCSDILSVHVDTSSPFTCTISDLSGRLLWQSNLFPDASDELLIDISSLHPGYYFLGITNNNNIGIAPFSVNK